MVDGLFMVDINHQQSHQPLPMVDGLLKFDKNKKWVGWVYRQLQTGRNICGIGHFHLLVKTRTDDSVQAAWQGFFFSQK